MSKSYLCVSVDSAEITINGDRRQGNQFNTALKALKPKRVIFRNFMSPFQRDKSDDEIVLIENYKFTEKR